jgi:hypothetical protein
MNPSDKIPPTAGSGPEAGLCRPGARFGLAAAGGILALFWMGMTASLRDKSLTYDEVVYAAAGYSQWQYGDFRLQPENGQLPERVAGLPLALSLTPVPAPDPAQWKDADQWRIGQNWFFRSGLDAVSLGTEGRMACGLFAVALGALVWAWSRRLYGPTGGLVSLLLFVLNPSILANGALMTSDMATALFLLAVVWGIWALLARFTPGRLLASSVLMGGLFLTKASALLIAPIALLLAAARLADATPLALSIGRLRLELGLRRWRALAIAGAAVFHAVVVVAMIWACYGFRYSAAPAGEPTGRFRIPWERLLAKTDPRAALGSLGLSADQEARVTGILDARGANETNWTNRSLDAVDEIRRGVLTPEQAGKFDAIEATPSPVFWVRMVELARRRHLLPEAWIYGFTDVYRRAQVRVAFLNGEVRLRGWASFFPYTFLVKTPLSLFAVMALAASTAFVRRPRGASPRDSGWWSRVYETVPLWALFGVYWAAAIASHLNIGHRHLLPTYPPLLVLCGAAGLWIDALLGRPRRERTQGFPSAARFVGIALAFLLMLAAAETAWFFPNYLAYFNGIVRPSNGFRHLVDSSLDWGQDLPAAKAYIDRQTPGREPFYFSYFGAASPDYYGVRAFSLYSVAGMDRERRPDWENLVVPTDDLGTTLTALGREWPDHDILGMVHAGDHEVVTLLRKPERLRLGGGTYLISATMLQPVNFSLSGPWGPWNQRYEAIYQELKAEAAPLWSPDLGVRRAAVLRRGLAGWPSLLERFEEFRFARLAAYLRQREPDDEINYSILVFRLSEADLAAALDGPPAELKPDIQTAEIQALPTPEKH